MPDKEPPKDFTENAGQGEYRIAETFMDSVYRDQNLFSVRCSIVSNVHMNCTQLSSHWCGCNWSL